MYSFTSAVLLALATASSVLAQTAGFDTFTNPSTAKIGTTIPANVPFKITWDPSPAPLDGKISIFLLQGATNTTLQVGDAIVTGLDSSTGSYLWNIKSDTPVFDAYGLKLSLDSTPTTFQFSTFFHISGLSGSSNSSSSTSGSATITSTSATVTGTKASSNGSTTSTSGIYSNSTKSTSTLAIKTTSTTGVAGHSTSQASTTSTSANVAATMGAGLMGAVAVVVGLVL